MLRAYQLSSATRGHHDSSSPWTLKDRADNTDPTLRTRSTVSTHILGLGIILVGVLALAVGLIMGLEFPKYVYEKNKEAQCVLHTNHENYRSWQSGIQWKREVKIFYWVLKNKDGFLYQGQKPQFIQRGPYVYTETEEKHNVRFSVSEVSFTKVTQYNFDKTSTEAQCYTCKENENLTILNPWYLRLVHEKGGETPLTWECIPQYTMDTLIAHGVAFKEDAFFNFQQNISLLGNFATGIITPLPTSLSDISFGVWLSSSDDSFPTVIQTFAKHSQFSNIEIKAIYSVFTNASLFYGDIYSKEVNRGNSQQSLQEQCKVWAEELCSNGRSSQNTGRGLMDCGVVYILHACHENNFHSSEVSEQLHSVFCPNYNSCLNFSAMSYDVAFEFRKMLSLFLVNLSNKVSENVLPSDVYDLVISRNQSDIALGFSFPDNRVNSHTAKGLLLQERYSSKCDSVWTVYTCLKNRDMDNNMKVKEYNGLRKVPNGLLRDSGTSVSLTSHTDMMPACSRLKACVDCDPSGTDVDVFVEDLLRPVVFVHKGRRSTRGVDVDRFEMSNATFTNASDYEVVIGVQNVTAFTGHLAWVGPPHTDSIHEFPSGDDQPSFLLVEPVTGRVWHKSIKLQFNVGFTSDQHKAHTRSISGDYINLPLPVFWTERLMVISSDEVNEFETLVIRLMKAACGGLIAFIVIAIIIAIMGVIICIYPSKPNKIIPMFEEQQNNNISNRHI